MFALILALSLASGAALAAMPGDEQDTRAQSLFEQARELEMQGRFGDALRPYRLAARNGHAKAAKRLGDLYYGAVPAIEPNYVESAKWYNMARVLGERVPARRLR